MSRLQRDCATQKLMYLKAALNFIQRFSQQTLADRQRLQSMVDEQEKENERLKKMFVFNKPQDSDNSDDDFDNDILASSSLAGGDAVSTSSEADFKSVEENDMDVVELEN